MTAHVELQRVATDEKEAFLEMALKHFRDLNPQFEPLDVWKSHYFETIQSKAACSLCWIITQSERVGFILFGVEPHRFLPRSFGMVYELFVLQEWRRRGVGEAAAIIALARLKAQGVARVQLEVMDGNDKAADLWKKLGFRKVSERYAAET
jgi:ribosomal protein S18 acetylase RimI-like enzyme